MSVRRVGSTNRLHSLHGIRLDLHERALKLRMFGDEICVEIIDLMYGVKFLDTDGKACVTHAGLAEWTLDTDSHGVCQVGVGDSLVGQEGGPEV